MRCIWRITTLFILCVLVCLRPAEARELTIAVLGDSLTSGYHLTPEDSFPVQLEQELQRRAHTVRVLNYSVPGSTSADGVARLRDVLEASPDIVLLALGANDVLHALPREMTRNNLSQIIEALEAQHVRVILAGVRMPFRPDMPSAAGMPVLFEALAKEYDIVLYPSILMDVGGNPALNLSDGLHPNPRGVGVMVQGILPVMEEAVKEME